MRFLLVSSDSAVTKSIEVPDSIIPEIKKNLKRKTGLKRVGGVNSLITKGVKKQQISKAIVNHGNNHNKRQSKSS
jgi:hypothetical protein|tara:strand:- start:990 stop:1214 length:225 start_codon:yes stop_codon:yes gene_type:complete